MTSLIMVIVARNVFRVEGHGRVSYSMPIFHKAYEEAGIAPIFMTAL